MRCSDVRSAAEKQIRRSPDSSAVQGFVERLFQFQIKEAIKAVRIEATKAYTRYAEEPKTSQRRWGFDMELELL